MVTSTETNFDRDGLNEVTLFIANSMNIRCSVNEVTVDLTLLFENVVYSIRMTSNDVLKLLTVAIIILSIANIQSLIFSKRSFAGA